MLLAFTLSLPAQDVLSFSVLMALCATRSANTTSRAVKCLFCERGSVSAVRRLPSGALASHWRLQVSGLGLCWISGPCGPLCFAGECADQLSSHWKHRPSCRYSTGRGHDSGRSEHVLGRVFELLQSTSLLAHKLLAYAWITAGAAHGFASFVSLTRCSETCRLADATCCRRSSPPMQLQKTTVQGSPHSMSTVQLPQAWRLRRMASGTPRLSAQARSASTVMTVTALPILRRINYNTFYYAHLMCSCLVFTSANIHANTNFYFLFSGLLLWVFDRAWRIFGGNTGLRNLVLANWKMQVTAGTGFPYRRL